MFVTTLASLVLSQSTIKIAHVKTVVGLRPVATAAAPSGSRFVACMEDRNVRIFDASTRATLRTMSGHPQTAYAVAWSPNGKWIASGDESGRIFFWDAATGKKIREIRTHTRGVQYASFNRTSGVLVTTGKDDTLRFYEVATGKELKVIYGKGANFYGARFMKGSDDVVVGTLGQGTLVYSKYSKIRQIGGHSDKSVWDVDSSATRLVSAGRDASAIVYDRKGAPIKTLKGHGDWVVRSVFSPNGRLLATSSSDSTVKVWNTANFSLILTISQQSMVGAPICFTADGKYLITTGNDDYLQVFSVTPGQA